MCVPRVLLERISQVESEDGRHQYPIRLGWYEQLKRTFGLLDTVFSHDSFMVAGVDSKKVIWEREYPFDCEYVFYSHELMLGHQRHLVPKPRRLGIVYESRAIVPKIYDRIPQVANEFRLIFTHDAKLLSEFPNARWIPASGVWIGGRAAPGVSGVHPKDRVVSMLSSNKVSCALHRKRLATALRLELLHPSIDVYLQGWNVHRPISPLETLTRYRYSIVMENFVGDGFFTEKILNCFATGTVPIYFGAGDIGRYFDPGGILRFTGYRDLVSRILPTLSDRDYENRLEAVQSNFDESKKYRSIEDFIVDKYGQEIVEGDGKVQ